MKQPHICMIVQSTYPFDPRVRREAEVLENAGYKIDIICLRAHDQPRIEKFHAITSYRVMKHVRGEGIFEYVVGSLCFFLFAFVKVLRLSFKNKYQLVQVHNMPDFLIFVGAISKMMGIPLVLDMHDMTVELFESKWPDKRYSFLLKIVKKIERLSCKLANHIITVTEPCKEILVQRGVCPDKITLILNTPDSNIFKFNSKRKFKKISDNAKLLYHGTVAKRFGLHILIDALVKVKEVIPNIKLSIYGKYDSDYKMALIKKIKSLNLTKNVHFHGKFKLEEIYDIINQSDIGVVPYTNDRYMNIALSTKTFEYVAAGLPVVASHLVCMGQIFDTKSICFCEPDNSDELGNKIIELCLNPGLRKKQVKFALENILGISWDKMATKYINLVEGLICKVN